ncbi:MAG: hypothetical protein LBV69_00745, partial [Bacteroidales bacterium]|nr:hypothetical protein [Bacteroidales bacterium]
MKKLIHKTKFSKIYVLITFFIAIVIIGITTSCEEKENKTVSDNTETVVKSVNIRLLFSESLVQAMLADISVYNISVNSHGILEFNNSEDLNEVIEILQNYSLQFEDTLELYPDYPILYAFEEHYNF